MSKKGLDFVIIKSLCKSDHIFERGYNEETIEKLANCLDTPNDVTIEQTICNFYIDLNANFYPLAQRMFDCYQGTELIHWETSMNLKLYLRGITEEHAANIDKYNVIVKVIEEYVSAFGECNLHLSVDWHSSMTHKDLYTKIEEYYENLYKEEGTEATLYIPYGTTIIDTCEICNLSKIKKVAFPPTLTTVEVNAFGAFKGHLSELYIPKTLTNIKPLGFSGSYPIDKIVVDKDNPVYDSRENCNAIIETATNRMIFGCDKTTFPESVTTIGESAFRNSGTLERIEIPESITNIETEAFRCCENLKEIKLPDNITCIAPKTFYGCSSLVNINFPQNLKEIGSCAFSDCYAIERITVPKTVEKLGQAVFSDCHSLQSVVLEGHIKTLPVWSFSQCFQLSQVVMSSSITNIEQYAFEWCDELKSIVIPPNVTTLGKKIFDNCKNLRIIVASAYLHERISKEYPSIKTVPLTGSIIYTAEPD